MADTKISALAAQTAAGLAVADLIDTVDVSDTTMAASGTNKKITITALMAAFELLNPGAFIPIGGFLDSASPTAPTNFVKPDGTNVARSGTYASLYSSLNPDLGVVTVVNATDLFTLNGHGLVAGDAVFFSSSGSITGVTLLTTRYFVIASGLTANDFKVSATLGGSTIDVTANSGTHHVWRSPWGVGDGSTTFTLPNQLQRMRVMAGAAGSATAGAARALGLTPTSGAGGEETHALITAELAAHTHTMGNHTHTGAAHTHTSAAHSHTNSADASSGFWGGPGSLVAAGGGDYGFTPNQTTNSVTPGATGSTTPGAGGTPSTNTSDSQGSGTAHNIMSPLIAAYVYVRYV